METSNQQDTKIGQLRNDPTAAAARFRSWERFAMGAIAIVLLGMLIVAAILNPDPTGMGTHQQLGLKPCSLVIMAGIRCPACGMTTSWALLMEGRLLEALYANTGGVLLAIAAIWTCAIFAKFSFSGKKSQESWFSQILLALLVTAMIAAAIQWIYRLYN